LSLVVAEKLTSCEHWSGAVVVVILAGQLIVGFCSSLTVTVNEQLAVLFEASVAVHVTVVVPFGKTDPDAGVQL
jgi:hypothetical protein